MKKYFSPFHLLLLAAAICFLAACGDDDKKDDQQDAGQQTEVRDETPEFETGEHHNLADYHDDPEFEEFYGEPVDPPALDLKTDLSKMNLEQLRLFRNEIFARKGHLFTDAILRGYFQQFKWYQPIWWDDEFKVVLTPDEAQLVEQIRTREQELLAKNYIQQNGMEWANAENLVNQSQFENLSPALKQKLQQNGFAIAASDEIQLFHVYEQNDYRLIPSFVTTDLYLQLYHLYFDYMLRKAEEDQFLDIVTELAAQLQKKAQAKTGGSGLVANSAAFASAWFAVAVKLSGGSAQVPAEYQPLVQNEVQKAQSAEASGSDLLAWDLMQYNMFKPRGHYTRSDELKTYFKVMMWLQTAGVDVADDQQLGGMVLAAHWISRDAKLKELYQKISEPFDFIAGEKDNLGISDLIDLNKGKSGDPSSWLTKEYLSQLRPELKKRNPQRIFTAGNHPQKDQLRLMFFPQRYTADAEMFVNLVHIDQGKGKRPFPKGLDVFASFGSEEAERILLEDYKEGQAWPEYEKKLTGMQQQFGDGLDWDASYYNKTMHALNGLIEDDPGQPYFMNGQAWKKKSLNTALCGWTMLKHDLILYAKQPMAAECGGWGPPQPVTPGYVEPNVDFWERMLELDQLLLNHLEKHGLANEELKAKSKQIRELNEFLLSVSRKELKGEPLTDEEYEDIRLIGSNVEYISLAVIGDEWYQSWSDVEGPDKFVSIVADVYTNANKNQVLEEAIGKVNEIYVMVEINGLLHLAKGAVLEYREFLQPSNERLTDEEWQQMLKSGNAPGVPMWMEPLYVPGEAPEVKKHFFFSSGC